MSFIGEIHEQPGAVRTLAESLKSGQTAAQIRELIHRVKPTQYVFAGMGSSLFASYIPCTYLCRKGIRSFAFEANELLSSDNPIIDKNTILIGVSQSGNSMETVAFCDAFQDYPMITVTNRENGNLSRYGDLQLFLKAGEELCTATKSYTNTIAMLVYLGYVLGGASDAELAVLLEEMYASADIIESMIEDPAYGDKLADFLKNRTTLTLVGSGSSYATACHSHLVCMEAAKELMIGYTAGQFIHGPLELINENFASILFDFEPNARTKVDDVMELTEKFGGKSLIFTNRENMPASQQRMVVPIPFENRFLAPLIEVVPMELMAYTIGERKNCQPGVLHRVHK